MTAARARIVVVGDELLEGRTVDTNSGRVERALGAHGLAVAGVETVPDRPDAIARALDRTAPGDLVVLTGGLGSTPDDLTREAVAAWAGVPVVADDGLRRRQEERWRGRGIRPRPETARQSQMPAGLAAVENPLGSAPALVGGLRDRTLVLLPGVPSELEELLPRVVARLVAGAVLGAPRATRAWRTAQLGELDLVGLCAPVREAHPDLSWSWWLTVWGCDVRVGLPEGGDPAALAAAAAALDVRLDPFAFSRGDETLPAAVQRLLLAAGRTVTVAESCTGGLIAARLTDTPGSSAVFPGGVVAYADAVKTAELGVPAAALAAHGAVSEDVVRAMSAGARERFGADYALAVSGIAGPDGGSDDKPVGTTWIGLATPAAVFARRYRFGADRARNRALTVAAALDSLRRVLAGADDRPPWREEDTWGHPR